MKQLPRFDRYLIYFALALPAVVAAFLFGMWLGPHVRIEVPLLVLVVSVGVLVGLRLAVKRWG